MASGDDMLVQDSSACLLQTETDPPPSPSHLHCGFWEYDTWVRQAGSCTSNRPPLHPQVICIMASGNMTLGGPCRLMYFKQAPLPSPSQFTHLHYGFQGCDSGWDLLADVLPHSPLAAGQCRPSWSRWFPWWGWPVAAPPQASLHPGLAWGPRCAARRDDMLSSHASHGTAAPEEKSSFIYCFICLNTCRVPHLDVSPWRFTMATIVLFPASQWVTAALHGAFWTAAKVVKVLPSWCKFCVHHTTMHQFTVSFYSKPHA